MCVGVLVQLLANGHDCVLQLIMISNAWVSVHACAGRKPRLPRRCKVKGQPSSSHIYRGAVSDSDSDSDSHKECFLFSDDSHHSHSTPSPPPDEEGMVNCSVLLAFVML